MIDCFGRWIREGSISRRLVLLVGLLCAVALLAATFLRYDDEARLKEIGRTNTSERQRLVSGISASEGARPETWIRSFGARADVGRFLRKPDAGTRKHLEISLRSGWKAYGIGSVSLFDLKGRRLLTLASSPALRKWNPLVNLKPGRHSLRSFYQRTPIGIVSTTTATVTVGGKPVGTMAVVRPWTQTAIDRLARATGTRVEIISRSERNAYATELGQDRFNWFEELRDGKGHTIAYRHFSANSVAEALYRISVLRTQTFILLLVAGLLAAVGTFLGTYVGRPLRAMREAISEGSTASIQNLLEDSTEIGEQARVIENWLTVKNELVNSNEWLEREVRDRMRELNEAYIATIRALVTAMEYRDQETKGHCERVTEMATTLGRALRLTEIQIDDLRRGALLHDIGKIAIPDTVLLKPGALTIPERAMMETHAEIGYDMLKEIRFLDRALEIPRCHHEKWDGTGYPEGLAGEDIPLNARIFALVDVWDALSSNRPYRRAWPPEKVREHVVSLSGSHFDPKIVAAFEKLPLSAFPTEYTPETDGTLTEAA